jgi:NAD+ synthase
VATLADRIAEWIAAAAQEASVRGAVVGLNGGVDSAVTAALCERALGENVLGLILPCESDRSDEEDARYVASTLGLATITVRLDKPFAVLADGLRAVSGLALANLKPRLRMAVLYYFANAMSYMVVGTGNKTELMVGYFTKHGDGGVDLLPLGGLYKTQVRQLARELGLPPRIIDKPPSAGLWDGQIDEEELGITYGQLDRALKGIESGRTDGIAPDIMVRVQEMFDESAHKRTCARVCEVSG